ncbi:Uncharacterized protein HSRCO_2032 [Halanaeroarchaeum sp. HSR-CO]|uniref:DUF5796 family protein n=1 Tax=Halanaeroarchaeum sp. HSR-CO TaxID=2866382 RepID=UPI00217D13EC|nr:DUF5796 family protein [Halanaeroarchaeum sp. HSR-CO]UWG48307.1 Uncharacterized protein HSRCO_2032 [Halanaeroarchaeum sp. HSR-CO]
MSLRTEVPPDTLDISLAEEGIYVTYCDGRRAFYNGVPETVHGTLRTRPGKDVQVLVTNGDDTEGMLTYVNERKTEAEILESSGVGRVMLDKGETEELFPGVTVTLDGYAIEVEADPETAGGRVFVFEEDEMGERKFELLPEE